MVTRRELLHATAVTLSGVAAGRLLTGCGGAANLGGRAMAAVPRAAGDPSTRPAAVQAVQAFGVGLYGRLAKRSENLVFSPYSVAVALAMTRNGAGGETAAEMDRVLHVRELDPFNRGLNALQQHLDGLSDGVERADGSRARLTLSDVNALWGQRGFEWRDAFLNALAQYYGAGVRLVDYIDHVEGARQQINAWVSRQTRERIPELIPRGVVGSLTRLVLVNAIYLKAPWEEPFDAEATRLAPFTRSDGSQVPVPMMRADLESAGYAAGPGWQAVRLPYAGGRMAMTVVLPDRGRMDEMQRELDRAALHRLLSGFDRSGVQLELPRWKFRTAVSLREPLAALGMPTAFIGRADFSGMTAQASLAIEAVLHQAYVAVDEEGTVAAAATAVGVNAISAPVMTATVTLDRPFLFVIHDVETAAPLFLGRVSDPSA